MLHNCWGFVRGKIEAGDTMRGHTAWNKNLTNEQV